jgi:hypothetical protein
MPGWQAVAKAAFSFDYDKWTTLLPRLAEKYATNNPIPHILLSGFLNDDTASEITRTFLNVNIENWTQYKHHNEKKLGMANRDLFPSRIRQVIDELNSQVFLAWLSRLTRIPNLVADPSCEGGGLHQSGKGGFLNIHTDFSHHHYHKDWRRRVNLILYLNPAWQPEWGGSIELWDITMRQCVVKYPPLFNDVLIFNTDQRSLHGFPEPIQCPEGQSRKSLALYYYSVESDSKFATCSTTYRPRPGEGVINSALISLDNAALDMYSRAKAHFGFSDQLASKILGFISRKL